MAGIYANLAQLMASREELVGVIILEIHHQTHTAHGINRRR